MGYWFAELFHQGFRFPGEIRLDVFVRHIEGDETGSVRGYLVLLVDKVQTVVFYVWGVDREGNYPLVFLGQQEETGDIGNVGFLFATVSEILYDALAQYALEGFYARCVHTLFYRLVGYLADIPAITGE